MSTETERVDDLVEMLGAVSLRLETTSNALSDLVGSYLADKRWRRVVSIVLGLLMACSVALGGLAVHTAIRVSNELAASKQEQCLRERADVLNLHAGVDSLVDRVAEAITFGEYGVPQEWAVEIADAAKAGIREDMPARRC